jgi:hypothetical protein
MIAHSATHIWVSGYPSLVDDALAARQRRLGRAIYGGVLYLTLLVVLAAQEPPPERVEIVLIIGVSALVYYVAHVYAACVPALAQAGRFHRGTIAHACRDELPILVAALIPLSPLVVHAAGVIGVEEAYLFAVFLTLAVLMLYVLVEGRRAGLSWFRTMITAALVLLVGIVVLLLELAVVH